MFVLTTHFTQLLKNVQPPQDRIQAARTLPSQVRDYLAEYEGFSTVSPYSHLVGSYAQDLCVGDVKDVDFLVRVNGYPEENEPEPKKLLRELKRTLDGLPEALGYGGFTGIDIEGARRSVHVYFEDQDFHLDVVPCVAPDGFENPLFIPDRSFNKWILSHPVGYIDLLNKLNNENGAKVKPLIRLLKHFRNYQFKSRKPKSYWLGALTVYHVQNTLMMTKSLAELFHDLLDAIYTQYDHLLWVDEVSTPNIKDPMLEHNISWNWGRSSFKTFMLRVDEGRTWAHKALEAENREEAIGLWQKVFGEEYFPSNVSKEAAEVALASLPGYAFIGTSGQVVGHKPDSGLYTLTKNTTFHGEE